VPVEYHTIYPDGTGVRQVVWNKGFNDPYFRIILLRAMA
jgi:hypothetical protein